jgi:hypothetical protein
VGGIFWVIPPLPHQTGGEGEVQRDETIWPRFRAGKVPSQYLAQWFPNSFGNWKPLFKKNLKGDKLWEPGRGPRGLTARSPPGFHSSSEATSGNTWVPRDTFENQWPSTFSIQMGKLRL